MLIRYHCISEDPKHDTTLWPTSLTQVVGRILKERPSIRHFEVTTDTSKKEFKAISVFKRIAELASSSGKTFMLSTFGPQHGKFLYDAAGSVWESNYTKKCVALLDVKADDLKEVVVCMNNLIGTPSSESSDISRRVTILTPAVSHVLSQWKSVPRTTAHFAYYITPDRADGVYYRRYCCHQCDQCKQLKFLACKNEYLGKWVFFPFRHKGRRINPS